MKNTIWMRKLVALAIGTLLAVVFFDLLPESIETFKGEPRTIFQIVLASIIGFFIIEKIIHYHHCVCEDLGKNHKKTHLIINNLIGDGLHNFVDGTIIAGAFLINIQLGIGTTIAVALHEIPQEISDFSILVYAGLSRIKAALLNLLFGLTSVLGAILVFVVADNIENIIPILLSIASGNFIYLAMADLIPELHHEQNPKRIWIHLAWVIMGIVLMLAVASLNLD